MANWCKTKRWISNLGITLACVAIVGSSHSATLQWDANSSTAGAQDGAGTWSLSANQWLSSGSNVSWTNEAAPHSAIIGAGQGAAGTIQITDLIDIQDLTLEGAASGNYTMNSSGAGQLHFADESIIRVNNNTTVNAVLASDGVLNIDGTQNLTLGGASSNLINGTTNLLGGTTVLSKSSNIKAIGGTVNVNTGATLLWGSTNNYQLEETTQLVAQGGSINFNNRSEKFQSFTQIAGGITGNNAGNVQLTGELRLAGGSTMTINSGGNWQVYSANFSGMSSSIQALLIGGNSNSVVSGLTIGEGGLTLNGQVLRINTTGATTNLGARINLFGDLTASGNNTLDTNNVDHVNSTGISEINLGTEERTFNIVSDTTYLERYLKIVGTGGLKKTGDGILLLRNTANLNGVDVGTLKIAAGIVRLANNEQIADSNMVVMEGGRFEGGGKIETLRAFDLKGGYAEVGAHGYMTLTETLSGVSGSNFTISSGSTLETHSANLNAMSFTLGANYSTAVSRFHINSGVLTLHQQKITLNRAFTEGTGGNEVLLQGNLVTTGSSQFSYDTVGAVIAGALGQFKIDGIGRTVQVTGSSDLLMVNVILAGNGSWTKTGAGTMTFAGGNFNTYQGKTILSEGRINLSKDSNVHALAGDIEIVGGTLAFGAQQQLPSTVSIHQKDGTINFGGSSQTMNNLTLDGGEITSTSNQITLTGILKGITGTSNGFSNTIYTINSGGHTQALGVDFSESTKTSALLIGGNSGSLTRLTVGSEGFKVRNNSITLNRENAGSEIALNGNLTANGTNNFNVGSLGATGTRYARFNHGSTTRTWDIQSGTTNSNLPIAGEGGGLIKQGSGTLIFNAVNTYTGKTTIAAGTLQLASAGGFSSSPWFEIAAGATFNVNAVSAGFQLNQGASPVLSGAGTVTGNITLGNGASIRPGMSSNPVSVSSAGSLTGTLSINGNVTATQTSANTVGYFNLKSATEGDRLSIIGNLSLNQFSNLKVDFDPSFTNYAEGNSWTIIDWSGSLSNSGFSAGTNGRNGDDIFGNEGNLDLPTLTGDLYWVINNFTTDKYLTVMIIPEPSKALLLTIGGCLLALRRRR